MHNKKGFKEIHNSYTHDFYFTAKNCDMNYPDTWKMNHREMRCNAS